MDDILITITDTGEQDLTIQANQTSLGTQYDNRAKRFVFVCPEQYQDDGLLLYFKDGYTGYAPVDLGTSRTYEIGSALTQHYCLQLQIAFTRDGEVVVRSNTLEFQLRASLGTGDVSPLEGGAPKAYVDEQAATVLNEAKAYADRYAVRPASNTALGGVKVGANLFITADGTLSAPAGPSGVTIASAFPELTRILGDGQFWSGMCFVKTPGSTSAILTQADFEQGSLAAVSGNAQAANTRIRTIQYHPVTGGVDVNVAVSLTRAQGSYMQINFFYYASDYSFLAPSTGWISDASWKTAFSTVASPPDNATYMKFIIADNYGTPITPDILSAVELRQGGEAADELWAFSTSPDDHAEASGKCRRYTFGDSATGLTLAGSFSHNWGHVNSVAYCPETDALICGNGSSDYSLPGEFYVFEKASGFTGMGLVPLDDYAIRIPATGYGSKVNVVWGENNNRQYDIAYIITNDCKNIRKIQLGKGSHNMGLGAYRAGKSAAQFNGSYRVLLEASQGNGIDVAQGMFFLGGKLYIGLGHDGYQLSTAVPNSDGTITYRVYREDVYAADGTRQTWYMQSPATRDGRLYVGSTDGKLREYAALPM